MNNSAAPVREIIFAHAVTYWLSALTVLLTADLSDPDACTSNLDGLTQLHCLYLSLTQLQSTIRQKPALFCTHYTASVLADARSKA